MIAWLFNSRTSLKRPSRNPRRAPKRNRSFSLENLEGRRLPSSAIQSIVTLPGITTNIVSGPDGDLWVGVSPTFTSAAVDRIGLDGQITPFALPQNLYGIDSLAVGPDGNVWFDSTEQDASSGNPDVVIGYVTPAGQVTVMPPIVVPNGGVFTRTELVSALGGDLWIGYTNLGFSPTALSQHQQNFIAQVTTAGAVTVFPIPALGSKSATIQSLAAGAEGNLWLTEENGSHTVLARMSPSGVVTRVPLSHVPYGSVANGPNGTLLVTGQTAAGENEALEVSLTGAIKPYKIPSAASNAFEASEVTADGSLWFANNAPGALKIGRITARGVAKSYRLPMSGGQQLQYWMYIGNDDASMVVGPDGELYVIALVFGEHRFPITTVYRFSPSELG